VNRDGDCWTNGDTCNGNNWFISWWVTDIEVVDIGPIP
jgi:hypothetical protein